MITWYGSTSGPENYFLIGNSVYIERVVHLQDTDTNTHTHTLTYIVIYTQYNYEYEYNTLKQLQILLILSRFCRNHSCTCYYPHPTLPIHPPVCLGWVWGWPSPTFFSESGSSDWSLKIRRNTFRGLPVNTPHKEEKRRKITFRWIAVPFF